MAKKAVFLVSGGGIEISPFLAPLEKSIWLTLEKSTIAPPLEKILRACLVTFHHTSFHYATINH